MKGLGFKGLEGFKAARVEGSGLQGFRVQECRV